MISFGRSQISNVYPAGDFQVLVLSDIHITNSVSKDKRLGSLIDQINNNKYPGVEMVVTCGDNVSSVYDSYTPDSSYHGYNRLQRFMDKISKLQMPFLITMGNHEYKIEKERDSDAPYDKRELLLMENIWQETSGFKPFYSKSFKGWKFIILNSMDLRDIDRKFGPQQLAWLESELATDEAVLVFSHHPLQTDNFRIWCKPGDMAEPEQEPGFYKILETHKEKIKGIFVGHGHLWVRDTLFDQIEVFETASFGDDETSPFLIIGIDAKDRKISVARSPFDIN
jgi:3',5'-cyclic AMP phosphodiesterase CpdA